MFDDVPVQVWLLIAFAAVAYMPAHYLYKHIVYASSRRDITQPPEDLSWRTNGQLFRSSSILAILLGLTIFIFMPAAERMATSPRFLPIVAGACGAWALITVPRGFATGKIQPFVRGIDATYERAAHPKRFWASMAWNALFAFACFWVTFEMIEMAPVQALEERCYDDKNTYSSAEELSSCNKLLQEHSAAKEDRARFLAARGSAYYRLRDYRLAKIDYANAIRLDPIDSSSHFNLGLVEEVLGNRKAAIPHYGAAIRVGTDDFDALVYRGLIFLDTGEFDQAVEDFTQAHRLKPKNAMPIANRGITYAWKSDEARAKQDFEAARALDPLNPVMLRGEALLSMKAGDLQSVVRHLTASLKSDPGNRWALRMRADAYERLGDQAKSDEDKDELWRLSKG